MRGQPGTGFAFRKEDPIEAAKACLKKKEELSDIIYK